MKKRPATAGTAPRQRIRTFESPASAGLKKRGTRNSPSSGIDTAAVSQLVEGMACIDVNTSSVKTIMMSQQSSVDEQRTAISKWCWRSQNTSSLRTPSCSLSARQNSAQQSEARHQQSLRAWHTQCTQYRNELQRWKRDLTRGATSDVAFPSFSGKGRNQIYSH